MIKLIPMKTVLDRYYIYYDDEVVGVVELGLYEDEVEIKYIKIHKEYRRLGIATKVINYIKDNHIDKDITGDSLPEAIEFWKSIGVQFYDEFDNDDVILTPFKVIANDR